MPCTWTCGGSGLLTTWKGQQLLPSSQQLPLHPEPWETTTQLPVPLPGPEGYTLFLYETQGRGSGSGSCQLPEAS